MLQKTLSMMIHRLSNDYQQTFINTYCSHSISEGNKMFIQ
jgi:hypothetical protein